ncbi:hypothetical protein BEP19_12670 [Ammoniphilus oxalaticus]|uniref:NADH-quinone oxidoreductase n=1 Tax=Ammoniphilus oxalaticus TaxID=66863 RepID=A0A419SH26_9BACL|nr:NADH-quinone oxidoreductase subunit C [Ammoniphilus oxalaticus]RKD23073.1 hypothetical protein BEP19_12670 [Ammoniphilus oxalaticus]
MSQDEKKAAAAKAREEAMKKLQAKKEAEATAGAQQAADKPISEMTEEEKKEAKAKAAAEAKAKVTAAAKEKAEDTEQQPTSSGSADDKAKAAAAAKAKAAAAAKAKAAAAAKAKAQAAGDGAADAGDDKSKAAAAAKAKAAAAAKAKAAAAAKAKAAAGGGGAADAGDDKSKAAAAAKAKAVAAAKAKAAAAAKAKGGAAVEDEEPKQPSPNQSTLDKFVKIISERVGEDAIEESYIREESKHMPTIVIKRDKWLEVASLLKEHPELKFDMVQNLLGIDFKEHMESIAYFTSYTHRHSLCIRVKTPDREDTKIASIANLWNSANWHERETYDLLGIEYVGHPDLRRILLTDDWVGHPLRKDYEQFDEEV